LGRQLSQRLVIWKNQVDMNEIVCRFSSRLKWFELVLHETELVIQIVEKLSVKLMKASDQKYTVNRNVRN